METLKPNELAIKCLFVRLSALKRLFKAKAFHLHTYGRDLHVEPINRLDQIELDSLQLDLEMNRRALFFQVHRHNFVANFSTLNAP